MICPNRNNSDFLDIVAAYGEVAAMKAFVLNNEEICLSIFSTRLIGNLYF
jgi:hypothetical protein